MHRRRPRAGHDHRRRRRRRGVRRRCRSCRTRSRGSRYRPRGSRRAPATWSSSRSRRAMRRARRSPGSRPPGRFSPGSGEIDADGAFVGYAPGEYFVTASFGATERRGGGHARARATCGARRGGRAGCRARRFTTEEVWVTRTASTPTSAAAAAATCSTRSTSAIRRQPVVTDSIVSNTRRVNDVMTTPDGKFIVFTREGAADRKNGIVIASLEDPAHPEGHRRVHRRRHLRRALGVRLQAGRSTARTSTSRTTAPAPCTSSTSTTRTSRRKSRSGAPTRPDAGRTLHDIDVQDGLPT